MFEPNRITQMVKDKRIPLGMQVFTGHPAMIEVLGEVGYDFIMIDCEHSPNNPMGLEGVVRTAEAAGLVTFARVSKHDNEVEICRSLEAGCHGIFLPLIQKAADVKAAADAAFFMPKGNRGVCPSVRASHYNWRTFNQYADWNNNEILLIPMIEQEEAVDNIEEICALEEVKMLVFAPGDLAFSMREGASFMASKAVQDAYRKVLDCCKRHGVAVVGGPVLDPSVEACRKSLDDGISIFCLGLDTMLFRRICEQTVAQLNTAVEGTPFNRPPAPLSGFNERPGS